MQLPPVLQKVVWWGQACLYRPARLWRKTVGRVVDWPPSPGYFRLGNAASAVAVCSLTSTALIDQLDDQAAAIIGRVYTPNLGLETMIRNVVSNPKLRYLVICGKESPVFRVGQSLLALAQNGLDDQGRIVGATGANAALTNLPPETVQTFLRQVELRDCIGETRPAVLNLILRDLHARQTPPYTDATPDAVSLHHSGQSPLEVPAQRRVWLTLDPLGYFIIHLDREKHELAVERYTTDKQLTHVIRGRAADMIYHTVIQQGLLSQFDHAAYLGAELAKAETALYNNLPYEQDKKLKIK